ncbi:hypothetical protein EPUL_001063 [Erysiphe pulchra]|uniref:CENP-T/Histone H4 histone fold domain-containing protein n=1 Tax=Erysiphe pulchra TaxID=225359 RepID=A0A2S4PUT7_9PEZI|nr:hypothetical protein EPUL_001063 [Erysiphe pulchra]
MSKTSSQAKKLRRNSALIQFSSRQANVKSDNSLEDLTSIETREEEPPQKTLAKTTPIHRAPKFDATSSLRSTRRSLNYNASSPSASQKLGSIKGPISITPHGRAAQRELHLRAGLTPAGRRKSGRNQQRETPRDDLRALSRLLAAKSQLIVPTSKPSTPLNNSDEEEDESDLIRPRLSIALKPDDEDDSFLLPPESTSLEDENITVKSIELARRAIDEQPYSRLSRGSFGSIRMSNNVFSNLNEEGMNDDVDNSSYLVNFRKDDPTLLPNIDNDNDLHFDDTGIFKFAIPERERLSQIDRDSGMQQNHLVTEDNDTFLLTVPSRATLQEPESEKRLFTSFSQVEEPLKNNSLMDETNLSFQGTPNITDIDSDSQKITIQEDSLEEAGPLRRKKLKLSQYGIPYPSLPAGVIKKLAITFAKTAGNRKPKINKETLEALMQATDWFFEQASDDLRVYAMHAGRKTIEESDVTTLMKRYLWFLISSILILHSLDNGK